MAKAKQDLSDPTVQGQHRVIDLRDEATSSEVEAHETEELVLPDAEKGRRRRKAEMAVQMTLPGGAPMLTEAALLPLLKLLKAAAAKKDVE